MASIENVLVENNGVFELVNASELLSFDINSGFGDAQLETNKESIAVCEKLIDLKLEPVEGGSQPLNEAEIIREANEPQTETVTRCKQRPLLRNKSFPGLAGPEDGVRCKMNDTAFVVWLARKKELHLAKKKAEWETERTVREQGERRAEQNKIAFDAWLARKKQQDKEKVKRPSRAPRVNQKISNPSAFEVWTRKKREELMKKVQIEDQRLKQEEEAAKLVDHDIASKAFQRYIQCYLVISLSYFLAINRQ